MGGMGGGAQSGEPFTNPFDIFEQFFGGGMGGMGGGGMGGFSRWAGTPAHFWTLMSIPGNALALQCC